MISLPPPISAVGRAIRFALAWLCFWAIRSFYVLILLVGGGLCVWGASIVFFQVVYWLDTGLWAPVSSLDIFLDPPVYYPPTFGLDEKGMTPQELLPKALRGSSPWLQRPTSWFGLHRIVHELLSFLPLSLMMLGIGIAAVAWARSADRRFCGQVKAGKEDDATPFET